MDNNAKATEILGISVSVDKQLAQFGEKLSALTNQTFSKMDALECASMISSLRAGLIEMNKKIIESYISDDKKADYFATTASQEAANFRDNSQYNDIIEAKANGYDLSDDLNQDDLPPIL